MLAAARQLFTDRGYDGASTRQIATDAGVSIATIFFHFSSKEQLFFEILDQRRRRLWDGLQTALTLAGPRWADRLATALTFHIESSCALDAGPIVRPADLRRLPGALRDGYIAQRDEYEQQFRDLILGGIGAGEFSPVDEKLTAAGMIAVGQAVAQWFRPNGRLTPRQIAERYVRLFFDGLLR